MKRDRTWVKAEHRARTEAVEAPTEQQETERTLEGSFTEKKIDYLATKV